MRGFSWEVASCDSTAFNAKHGVLGTQRAPREAGGSLEAMVVTPGPLRATGSQPLRAAPCVTAARCRKYGRSGRRCVGEDVEVARKERGYPTSPAVTQAASTSDAQGTTLVLDAGFTVESAPRFGSAPEGRPRVNARRGRLPERSS